MSNRLRVRDVVAAVVHNDAKRFFVAFNRRWHQYAFPMKGAHPGDDLAALAVKALADHCPLPLEQPQVKPLEYMGGFGASWSTGEDTYYNYHVFQVTSPSTAQWPAGKLGDWCGFLDHEELGAAPLVSWSTKAIVDGLLFRQSVAIAAISRDNGREREYLFVEKAGYAGYFFPATRVKDAAGVLPAAREAVSCDTGYVGPIEARIAAEIETRHHSARYDCNRNYRFYICPIEVSGVDIAAPGNAVEQSLAGGGYAWRWVADSQLDNPAAHGLSPTVDEVRGQVRKIYGIP